MNSHIASGYGSLVVFSWGSFDRLKTQLSALPIRWEKAFWVDPFAEAQRITAFDKALQHERIGAVLSTGSGDLELRKYSLPELYSLTSETSALKSLLPGLKATGMISVPAVTGEILASRLKDLREPFTVIIDCPGQEHVILAFLETSGLMQKVDTLYLRAGDEPFFEGSHAAVDLVQMLEKQALSAGEIYDDADPNWPVYRFKSDQRTRLVNNLRAQLDDLAQDIKVRDKEADRLTTELAAHDEIVSQHKQSADLRAKEIQQLTKERDAGHGKVAQMEEALKKLRKDNTVQHALSTEKTTRLSYEAQQLRLDLRRATAVQETLQSEKDILRSSNKAIEEENQKLRQLLQQLTPKLREAAEQVRKITSPTQASSILNKESTKSPKTKAGNINE
ncbi:hypothetical protein [Sulfitobacter sp. D7]|uniref:hypothetical protein n=1 Tax=Sulfitobacter sp. D7 TaxID=1968541 RepID=UPI000E77769D|nr:hypothetical protein [Sulfitobacter sp. D7]AYE88257.1 hypothetical protein B5M07_18770 [Sulfitobacter sp. D7]